MLTIGSEYFDLHSEGDKVVMIAEVSELQHHANAFNMLAAAEGFNILSRKTGQRVKFELVSIDTCGDDVAGWRYQPEPGETAKLSCRVEVLIIND